MPAKELILDFCEYDLDRVIADQDEIRLTLPQRHEMEQLTAIVLLDPDRQVCVGYKDVTPNEFWVRGHMPGFPLMPGVMMCEAAAQLTGYYSTKTGILAGKVMGFGGLEEVRFRDPVRPGDRLVLAIQVLKARHAAMVSCRFQGFVRQSLVVEGVIKGVALPGQLMEKLAQDAAAS